MIHSTKGPRLAAALTISTALLALAACNSPMPAQTSGVIPASERGHVDYVRWVVGTGIDVNHVNDLGWTALLEAVVLGDGSRPYQDIVRALLAAGADPSIEDKDGRTALDHARTKVQARIVRILDAA